MDKLKSLLHGHDDAQHGHGRSSSGSKDASEIDDHSSSHGHTSSSGVSHAQTQQSGSSGTYGTTSGNVHERLMAGDPSYDARNAGSSGAGSAGYSSDHASGRGGLAESGLSDRDHGLDSDATRIAAGNVGHVPAAFKKDPISARNVDTPLNDVYSTSTKLGSTFAHDPVTAGPTPGYPSSNQGQSHVAPPQPATTGRNPGLIPGSVGDMPSSRSVGVAHDKNDVQQEMHRQPQIGGPHTTMMGRLLDPNGDGNALPAWTGGLSSTSSGTHSATGTTSHANTSSSAAYGSDAAPR